MATENIDPEKDEVLKNVKIAFAIDQESIGKLVDSLNSVNSTIKEFDKRMAASASAQTRVAKTSKATTSANKNLSFSLQKAGKSSEGFSKKSRELARAQSNLKKSVDNIKRPLAEFARKALQAGKAAVWEGQLSSTVQALNKFEDAQMSAISVMSAWESSGYDAASSMENLRSSTELTMGSIQKLASEYRQLIAVTSGKQFEDFSRGIVSLTGGKQEDMSAILKGVSAMEARRPAAGAGKVIEDYSSRLNKIFGEKEGKIVITDQKELERLKEEAKELRSFYIQEGFDVPDEIIHGLDTFVKYLEQGGEKLRGINYVQLQFSRTSEQLQKSIGEILLPAFEKLSEIISDNKEALTSGLKSFVDNVVKLVSALADSKLLGAVADQIASHPVGSAAAYGGGKVLASGASIGMNYMVMKKAAMAAQGGAAATGGAAAAKGGLGAAIGGGLKSLGKILLKPLNGILKLLGGLAGAIAGPIGLAITGAIATFGAVWFRSNAGGIQEKTASWLAGLRGGMSEEELAKPIPGFRDNKKASKDPKDPKENRDDQVKHYQTLLEMNKKYEEAQKQILSVEMSRQKMSGNIRVSKLEENRTEFLSYQEKALKNITEWETKIRKQLESRSLSQEKRAEKQKTLINLQKERVQLIERAAELNQEMSRIYERQQNIAGNLSSYYQGIVSLAQDFGVSVSASVSMQMQTIDALEKQRKLIKLEQRQIAERYDAEEQSALLQEKMTEAKNKELQITQAMTQQTKSLREGWVDAVKASTRGQGAFAKFIIDQENIGAAVSTIASSMTISRFSGAAGADKGFSRAEQYDVGGGLSGANYERAYEAFGDRFLDPTTLHNIRRGNFAKGFVENVAEQSSKVGATGNVLEALPEGSYMRDALREKAGGSGRKGGMRSTGESLRINPIKVNLTFSNTNELVNQIKTVVSDVVEKSLEGVSN